MRAEIITWRGEANRSPDVARTCECGTCQGFAPSWAIGNLSFSNSEGVGVTIWLDPEAFVGAKLALR